MSTGFFGDVSKIPFEGVDSTNPLAFRYYDPNEVVMGKRMEDHLRFAVCYLQSVIHRSIQRNIRPQVHQRCILPVVSL